jgi:hypothetical protein
MTAQTSEHLTDEELGGLAVLLQMLTSRVNAIIVQKQVRSITKKPLVKKKTPRPKARRKG